MLYQGGIYEPIGPEYESFLVELGIDKNDLNAKPQVFHDKEFFDTTDPVYDKPWHPGLTHEQILYALRRDIYEPVGQEYEMFLRELGLGPIPEKKKEIYSFSTPTPTPMPTPTPNLTPNPIPSPSPSPTFEFTQPHHIANPPIKGDEPVEENIPEKEIEPVKEDIPEIEPVKEDITSEERYNVVRIERRDKLAPIAGVLATLGILGFGVGAANKNHQAPEPSSIIWQIDESPLEDSYQDETLNKIIYSLLSEKNVSIGDIFNLDSNTQAYYYGNLTGKTTTVSGNQAITGFCLYSPDTPNEKYEYSFYEDRKLDGTPDRTNVEGIDKKVDVSLDEFLSALDIENYDLDNIKFSLHLGDRGWIDASDLIKVNKETSNDNIQRLTEVVKQSATYKGITQNETDFVNLAKEGSSPIWVKITDDETDELLPSGTIVKGSDGKEYAISKLEKQNSNDDEKVSWNIMDCNLALSLAPLVTALALTVQNKIKNQKNKDNPSFFEFDKNDDYQRFLNDFKKAKEEYEKTSKFKTIVQRIFTGKKEDVLSNLTEEQIKELYKNILTNPSGDYAYSNGDSLHFINGRIYSIDKRGNYIDITERAKDIGKDNPKETTGLLTDEIKKEYGGGIKG